VALWDTVRYSGIQLDTAYSWIQLDTYGYSIQLDTVGCREGL